MVKKLIINQFIKKNIITYIVGFIFVILANIIELIMPKLLGYIIDLFKQQSVSINKIYGLVFLMLGLGIIIFIFKFFYRIFLMGKSRDLECFLREKLFSHLQSLPPEFYNNKKTGDLMAYATNDLSAIRMAFAFGLVFLIEGLFINIASIIVMSKTINFKLTIIAIVPIITALLSIIKLRKIIRERFSIVQGAFANLSDKIQENISGIRVVKSYVQEKNEIKKLEKSSIYKKEVQLNYIKVSGFLNPIGKICFGVSFTLVLIIGSFLVKNGEISLGDFIAFNTYIGIFVRPINQLGRIVEVWQRALASIKRLDEIFEEKTYVKEKDLNNSNIQKFKGKIEIKNLNFNYPNSNQKILKNINIKIQPGKTLAIIGKTGSGKTTLLNLLLKLYDVERGHIFIDDIDINDIPLPTLRENIGYVPQDNFLFSSSIKENISFFSDEYDDKDIEEATKISSVYNNIIDFPKGFDTLVGERGITLSGGQKQRISIARAVIKNPSILILDDSLSAVDTKTEEEIIKNIKSILKERTGIIIAHRISTIKYADEIILLDKGEIIERGTHESLLNKKGEYYKLYCSQILEDNEKRGIVI
ncbi:ABC transporter ATP-binding protein [Defluviitalea phaphyphila]|uniref:ABC transporter ATP-binding protein n=1 Tax=Defluviitalea phaphyphila TaxID=1473580 RepID=UPI0007310352|nr:ABC transporter ATP-binding protein [Defluviitalea phaphyphila]